MTVRMDHLLKKRISVIQEFWSGDFRRLWDYHYGRDIYDSRDDDGVSVAAGDRGTILDAYWEADGTLDLMIKLDRGDHRVWVTTSWPNGNGRDSAPLYIQFLRSPLHQLADCAE